MLPVPKTMGCPLPIPGRYVIEFYCRGQLVCDLTLDAQEEEAP
jgi:hypothetical protein